MTTITDKKRITIAANINAPIEKVWAAWTQPDDVIQWNSPSPDWHTPKAFTDLKAGGKFNYRMEAKDGSMGFDFGGTYRNVEENKHITYVLDDNREVENYFAEKNGCTYVETVFDPENQNSEEMQRDGWQAILDSFKNYVENK